MNRPKILVTLPGEGATFAWLCIRLGIFLAGGIPTGIRPGDRKDSSDYDGLILSGGNDIHPRRYGTKSLIETVYDEPRDQMELELTKQFIQMEKPILGICRGMQLLNVYFQGTLYQELSQFFNDFLPATSTLGKVIARHRITIREGSKLHKIFGSTESKVNSLHHQGVENLGKDLLVTAALRNGIIQGIEHTGNNWILGVQWHPEFILHKKPNRKIFNELVRQSEIKRKSLSKSKISPKASQN